MLHRPNQFAKIIRSVVDGTQPSVGNGTTLTPGFNTYGAWAQIFAGADVTHDVYEVDIRLHGGFTSGQARDILVTLGIDLAGGTSYVPLIEHLSGSMAGFLGGSSEGWCGGGHQYLFKIRIPAGASIAAKASVNNATVGAINIMLKLSCKPSNPERVDVGKFAQTFGATLATSSGTSVVVGQASEGAWVELGTLTRPLWGWEVGVCINDATIANTAYYSIDLALGDATNKRLVIEDAYFETTRLENLAKRVAFAVGHGAIGDKVYGRIQRGTGTLDDNVSMIAYGVG